MLLIPQSSDPSLRQALTACDEFYSPRQLYALFGVNELKAFQTGLPEANNLRERIDLTTSYLQDKYRSSGENALILFLQVLAGRYDLDDERHDRLLNLAEQLQWYNDCPPQPETIILEANSAEAQKLWIAEAKKMIVCAQSVARVDVLRFRNGEEHGKGTGTAWLVAPGLALTCWHVVESRDTRELSVSPTDLQAQIDNLLLTFDFTASGHGLQYEVAKLEYPPLEARSLDYALLRLTDRTDAPLRDRGYLQLDLEAPLTVQTSLYIIQHPLGQPQQVAGDTFMRYLPGDERILYKTPTEPGTSGAPVFNRVNWRVVALHNGENKSERLREGTLLKAILSDLNQHRPDLYQKIMNAQTERSK